MTDLAQDLLSSFLVAESQLNGSRNLGVVSLRKKSMDRFEQQGFPTTRDEEWKYTNLKPVLKQDYLPTLCLQPIERTQFMLIELSRYQCA